VNLPIGIVGTITAARFVPNTRPRGGQSFDWLGAGLFFVAMLTFLLALTYGQDVGFSDPGVVAGLGVAVLALGLFVVVERRITEPMVDLTLFRSRNFTVNLVTGFVTFVSIAGLLILLPFYLGNVLGYDTRAIGLLLAAVPITLGITAPLSGSFSDRVGTRPVTVGGLAALTIGYAVAAVALGVDTSAAVFVAVGLIIGAGMGIFQSPNNSAILGSVPPSRLGITSGMLAITRITGQIVGIAVLGTVWAARTTGYAGGGTAESAPASAQANGLSDTLVVTTALCGLALALALWTWRRERNLGLGTDRLR
jgi:MFS family permease